MKEEKTTFKRLKMLPVLFRKQDCEKVAPYSNVFLSRAVKNGLIHRLNRGNYINSFLYGFPNLEQVACFLKPPAYISCEWALNHHGISLQVPHICTVITLSGAVGKGRDVEYQGIGIEFSRIAPKLFNGFTVSGNVNMALPEKAILDTLYLHGKIAAEDELEIDSIDFGELIKMSHNYPKSIQKYVQEKYHA